MKPGDKVKVRNINGNKGWRIGKLLEATGNARLVQINEPGQVGYEQKMVPSYDVKRFRELPEGEAEKAAKI